MVIVRSLSLVAESASLSVRPRESGDPGPGVPVLRKHWVPPFAGTNGGKNTLLVLQGYFGVLHRLGKLLQIGLVERRELLGRRADHLVGGGLEPRPHLRRVERLGSFALDQRHDVA